jgi:hypothetical protein
MAEIKLFSKKKTEKTFPPIYVKGLEISMLNVKNGSGLISETKNPDSEKLLFLRKTLLLTFYVEYY